MPRLSLANNFETTLASGINDSVTEIEIVGPIPAGLDAPFRLTIHAGDPADGEIVEVTAVAVDDVTLTVIRGDNLPDGDPDKRDAKTWSLGDTVELLNTAGVHGELEQHYFLMNEQEFEDAVENEQLFNTLITSPLGLGGLVNSIPAMDIVTEKESAINAIIDKEMALNAAILTPVSFNALLSSELAINTIEAVSGKPHQIIIILTGLDPVAYDDLEAIAVSESAMHIVSENKPVMDYIQKSESAWGAINDSDMAIGKFVAARAGLDPKEYTDIDDVLDSETALDAIVGSTSAMDTVFSSVTTKRKMFDSEDAEKAIRNSRAAMTVALDHAIEASASIRRDLYNSPAPLNTPGKWFIVACTYLYITGTYSRGIRYWRHDLSARSGTWGNFAADTVGITDPDYVAIPTADDFDFNSQYSALHGRFFTGVEVMTRSDSTSTSNQTYLYIDFDS